MSLFDNQPIDVPCPKCGHKIKQQIGRLKSKQDVVCPECGSTISLNADKLLKSRDSLEKKLNQMGFKKK